MPSEEGKLSGFLFPAPIEKGADISDCGRYRYRLWRQWGEGRTVCFIGLNPSTADGVQDDPTVRRMVGFAKSWGYSRLDVRNLFALRATNPKELLTADTPTGGPRGDLELLVARTADLVVCAWGAKVPFGRDREVLALLKKTGTALHCIGRTTKQGNPRHPLYCRALLKPTPFPEDTP